MSGVEVREPPAALVEDGRIHEGFFRRPARRVDMLSAARPRVPGGRLGRRLRLKEWVGFGMSHPDLYGGILVQHAGYAASGAVYVYDRVARRHYEWAIVDLPTRVHLPESLWHDRTVCGRGRRRIWFEHDLDHGRHRLDVEIDGERGMPLLRVDLRLRQDLERVDPLVVSLPIAPEHHTYTHTSTSLRSRPKAQSRSVTAATALIQPATFATSTNRRPSILTVRAGGGEALLPTPPRDGR